MRTTSVGVSVQLKSVGHGLLILFPSADRHPRRQQTTPYSSLRPKDETVKPRLLYLSVCVCVQIYVYVDKRVFALPSTSVPAARGPATSRVRGFCSPRQHVKVSFPQPLNCPWCDSSMPLKVACYAGQYPLGDTTFLIFLHFI